MTKSFNLDYAKYYDFFNKGKSYEKETDFLEQSFKKYSSKPVKTILNLGCGTGMHEIQLSNRGFNITGLDLSGEMIEIAKSKNIPESEFFVGDMSDFSLDKRFDSIISMFAAFGYLLENKQIENSLKCVKEHLKKDGLFIFDVWNGLGVLKELPSSRKKEIIQDNFLIKRQSFPSLDAFNHKVDINFKVEIFENEKEIENYEEMHKMRFFFPQEIIYHLEKAGLEVLEICKAFELGGEIDENEWNMVIVCRSK